MLERTTSTEYDDDGNIVGYGLTLRETVADHSVERIVTERRFDVLQRRASALGARIHPACFRWKSRSDVTDRAALANL